MSKGGGRPLPDSLINLTNCTGRVLIDLSNEMKNIQFETCDGKVVEEYCSRLIQKEHKSPRISIADILGSIAKFCTNKKLDSIQLLDMDLLFSNSAFDDNTAFEILGEKLDEALQYEKVALIIDAESLTGVTENESQSNMGPSTSFSIQNHKMWSWIVNAVKRCAIGEGKEHWVFVVAEHSHMTKLFKRTLHFPKCRKELEDASKEEEARTVLRNCAQCHTKYFEADNKLTDCKYHDGILYVFGDDKKEPVEVINPLSTPMQIDKMKYSCCLQGYSSAGCTNGKHSEKKFRLLDHRQCKDRRNQ